VALNTPLPHASGHLTATENISVLPTWSIILNGESFETVYGTMHEIPPEVVQKPLNQLDQPDGERGLSQPN
jgi:hypothetical protein